MDRRTYTWFYVIFFSVLSTSASDVFIINAKPSGRSPLSVSVDRPLQILQRLLGKKADEDKTLRVQLLSSVKEADTDKRDRLSLRPASSRDLTKSNVADLLRLLNKNVKKANKPPDVQYRLFRNMYGVPKKPKAYAFKKAKVPFDVDSSERLQPLIKYILSHKSPNVYSFKDLTRFDASNITEDYIDIVELSRQKPIDSFSHDYIDFDSLTFRKNNNYPVKAALRSYSVETNDDSSEARKSKRFEIIKNKNNKKDIKSTETDEVKNKQKKKATFNKKSNKKKVMSTEDAGTSLSSENEASMKHVRQKPNKKRHEASKKKHKSRMSAKNEDSQEREKPEQMRYQSAKAKPKFVSQENDEWHDDNESVALYLQGNKLTMYPPMDPNSSEENNSDDTRRRGDRLPYFLPKRNHWHKDDIHSLGYFFFNGPKGISLER